MTWLVLLPLLAAPDAADLAETYAEAIEKVNTAHAVRPRGTEAELAEKLPAKAAKALERLLGEEDAPATFDALVTAGEAALDLDLAEDVARIRARLAASPEHAARLGAALSRPRFVLRGIGLDDAYLAGFADVLELVLAGYDELYGFAELSKVPGKKLRVRVHLVDRIERPPRFEPQHPFHSEIDFPVADAGGFSSPTPDGKFLFYGLCHELGHVVAMWGDTASEEDHHAWAHYTGVAVCEHVLATHADHPALERVRDDRWRSLAKLREEVAGVAPGRGSRGAVLALLVALHDAVGPRAIGAAIDHLDERDRRLRVNRVRYYSFRELRDGLRDTLADKAARERVDELLE
jgi:hypothetical protein